MEAPALVLKKSPTCPISHAAEAEWRRFLEDCTDPGLTGSEVDVLAQRALARGLTAALGIRHESPQVLLFRRGHLVWHESHGAVTGAALRREVARVSA
jgi:bacillithiol system protein YtxJ